MDTLTQLTQPLQGLLRPVPPQVPGICQICRRPTRGTFPTCYSCDVTSGQVSRPLYRITPITLYETGGQVWHHLRNYKDSPDRAARERLTVTLLAVLVRFLGTHEACVAPDGWDAIVGVPSTRHPNVVHPLVAGMQRVGSLQDRIELLLAAGDRPLDHNQADDRGYRVTRTGATRILVVDDTLTTGARIQSAASALSRAGYQVVGGLVVGRVLDPRFDSRHAGLWESAGARGFDFGTCCRCVSDWQLSLA